MALIGARRGILSPVWNPRRLGARYGLDWCAADTGLITLSGAQITSWKDRLLGLDATQGVSGARPLWSGTSYAGMPGATFDASNDYLEASVPAALPVGSSPCEFWALIDQNRAAADTTGRAIASYGGDASTAQRRLLRTVTSGQNRVAVQTGTGASTVLADNAVEFFGPHLIRGIVGAAETTAGMDELLGTPVAGTPSTGSTRFRIGAVANASAASFLGGGLNRLIVIFGTLTPTEAARMRAYLL